MRVLYSKGDIMSCAKCSADIFVIAEDIHVADIRRRKQFTPIPPQTLGENNNELPECTHCGHAVFAEKPRIRKP